MAHVTRFWPVWGLVLLLMQLAPVAQALEVTVSARYMGGASGQFENTTPVAEFCQRFGHYCVGRDVVDLPVTYNKEVNNAGSREQFFIKMPGQRQVEVFHEVTGEPHTLFFEFTGVSQTSTGPSWYDSPVYTSALQGGCTRVAYTANPPRVFFLWDITQPVVPTGCYSLNDKPNIVYPQFVDVIDMGVSFNLTSPIPLRMRTGIYRGSITYNVGPGGDFDFGDGVTALVSNSVKINFVLDVQHAFAFNFPPGTERAVLEPRDGWQHWLAGGSVPQRLYRDLPFRLSSTGPISVYKLCQYDIDIQCGIVNEKGDQAPVLISLSLPAGLQYQGKPVHKVALPTGRAQALKFDAVQTTFNRPGQIHFEIAKEDVRRMLPNAGSVYTGLATVVFDAEL